jgi:CBS domain-containing protein
MSWGLDLALGEGKVVFKMNDKLVRDVMHRGVISCWADESLFDVAHRLREYSINAIFVLDDSGRAEGVISQIDLARAYVQGEWQDRAAEEIMTPELVTVPADVPLLAAVQIMLDKRIRRLLIVQGGRTPNRPVGVLSLSDVVAEMCKAGG